MTTKQKCARAGGAARAQSVLKTEPVYSTIILALFEGISKFFALLFLLIAVLELGAGIEGLQPWGQAVLLAVASGSAGAALIWGGERDA